MTMTVHPTAQPLALDLSRLTELVEEVADAPQLWLPRVRFGTRRRWWTRLHADDTVDVWLITWRPDSATDLHDHGDSSAVFTVVDGRLDEVRPADGGRRSTPIRVGQSAQVQPGAIHDVRNPGPAPAVSIHAYSPPLSSMTFYEPHGAGLRQVRTIDTVEPEVNP